MVAAGAATVMGDKQELVAFDEAERKCRHPWQRAPLVPLLRT
jgi:hypothetical protein